jgi:uncharacterized alkaline shock family protein YloU
MSNIKLTTDDKSGKVVYNEGIVRGIVALAISEVEGAEPLPGKKNGISLYIEKDGIYVDVSVIVKFGPEVPELAKLAYRIQQSIKQNVENMTKYKVAKVDVHVQDVVYEEPSTVHQEEVPADDAETTDEEK